MSQDKVKMDKATMLRMTEYLASEAKKNGMHRARRLLDNAFKAIALGDKAVNVRFSVYEEESTRTDHKSE